METREKLRQDSALVLTNLSGLSLRIPSVLTHMAYHPPLTPKLRGRKLQYRLLRPGKDLWKKKVQASEISIKICQPDKLELRIWALEDIQVSEAERVRHAIPVWGSGL